MTPALPLAAIALALALAGCGQKGPLKLPESPPGKQDPGKQEPGKAAPATP